MRLQRSVRVVERKRLWRSFERIEEERCDFDDGLMNWHVWAFVESCKATVLARFIWDSIEGLFSQTIFH